MKLLLIHLNPIHWKLEILSNFQKLKGWWSWMDLNAVQSKSPHPTLLPLRTQLNLENSKKGEELKKLKCQKLTNLNHFKTKSTILMMIISVPIGKNSAIWRKRLISIWNWHSILCAWGLKCKEVWNIYLVPLRLRKSSQLLILQKICLKISSQNSSLMPKLFKIVFNFASAKFNPFALSLVG